MKEVEKVGNLFFSGWIEPVFSKMTLDLEIYLESCYQVPGNKGMYHIFF